MDLFIYTLGDMRSSFFAASRLKYARWMVCYHLNLLNIDKIHTAAKLILSSGGITVCHTVKNFSTAPVDLTLVQTVNADAASRLTCIAAFGADDSARKRSMITRAARSSIVSKFLAMTGNKSIDNTAKYLKLYRIKKVNEDLNKIAEGVNA